MFLMNLYHNFRSNLGFIDGLKLVLLLKHFKIQCIEVFESTIYFVLIIFCYRKYTKLSNKRSFWLENVKRKYI